MTAAAIKLGLEEKEVSAGAGNVCASVLSQPRAAQMLRVPPQPYATLSVVLDRGIIKVAPAPRAGACDTQGC